MKTPLIRGTLFQSPGQPGRRVPWRTGGGNICPASASRIPARWSSAGQRVALADTAARKAPRRHQRENGSLQGPHEIPRCNSPGNLRRPRSVVGGRSAIRWRQSVAGPRWVGARYVKRWMCLRSTNTLHRQHTVLFRFCLFACSID